MLVIGMSGGLFRTHEDGSAYINKFAFHDGAAVLLDGGKLVAAIEMERLNRIKHSNKLPVEAIKFCLESYGARIQDVDHLAYYSEEQYLNVLLEGLNIRRTLENHPFDEYWDARSLLTNLLSREFACDIPPEKLVFVTHHYAHALSAFLPSGFDQSLVLTLDGEGDYESGRVMIGKGRSLELLASYPTEESLGVAYANIIGIIGFQGFDEYKAMGLAPYGDPARFRKLFSTFYEILPKGAYKLKYSEVRKLLSLFRPRKKGGPFTQEHMDVAAALQEALEKVVFHILAYYRQKTGQSNLSFAGGVAHNCTLNGKILESKLFDQVFIQPAAHDAGCAYGAALSIYLDKPEIEIAPMRHLYWGRDASDNDTTLAAVSPWREFLSIQKVHDICHRTARLIADGSVIGWVQGRSEFGPRALGNRSIIADPRPAENKSIINAMVKKREAFRPFAPSVLEEYAEEFFEVDGSNRNLSYMLFVVKVRPEKQKLLGAVTHVDGTARIQTVSKETNEKYWELIDAFRQTTGIPVLLNTSFNNNVEPIVDSVDDAVACFLTTKLHYLVVGDYLISKKEVTPASYLNLIPFFPRYTILRQDKAASGNGDATVSFEGSNNFDPTQSVRMSEATFDILVRADGRRTLEDLLSSAAHPPGIDEVYGELNELWARRVISLKPGGKPRVS
jgi:carbamoyltransferase